MDIKKTIATIVLGGAIAVSGISTFLPSESEQAYEFLVRLQDKTSESVVCKNPEHDEEVIFSDSTFNAPCPVCGETEWLERENDTLSKKGHFITFKPEGWTWGRNELKHYGIVKIRCSYEQAQAWCSPDTLGRKPKFDIEKALSETQLSNWEDIKSYCDIVDVDSVYVKTPVVEVAR